MATEDLRRRCFTCGFLALRNEATGTLDEAPKIYRDDGLVPRLYPIDPTTGRPVKRPVYHYEGEPICFVRAYPLRDEVEFVEDAVKAQLNQAVLPEKVKDIIIGTERNCGANGRWTHWQQGFTPKEHREMLDRQWQIDQERKWRREERRWRVGEVILLVAASSLFTIVGAQIQAAATERAAAQIQPTAGPAFRAPGGP